MVVYLMRSFPAVREIDRMIKFGDVGYDDTDLSDTGELPSVT